MITITMGELFEGNDQLLMTLVGFLNIPDVEVRSELIKAFCNHDQMKPVLEKHNILPDFFYYYLITNQ